MKTRSSPLKKGGNRKALKASSIEGFQLNLTPVGSILTLQIAALHGVLRESRSNQELRVGSDKERAIPATFSTAKSRPWAAKTS